MFWGRMLMHRPFTFESFMNKLRPGAIAQIDPGEDGMLRTSNVTKFHESCFANGLPPEDIFLRDDLIDATSDSITRVAMTIIALIKWAEMPAQTHSHLSRVRDNLKPAEIPATPPPPPSRHSQTGVGSPDPVPLRSFGQHAHESIADSTKNQSPIRSERKSSTVQSVKNQSSMRNQSIAYRRTKLSMTPKNVTTNSTVTYSSLRDASIGNESNSADKVRANPCVSRVEGVVDFPVVSGASCARTGDCSESRQVLVMDERKAWTQFVGVSPLFDGFCCCGSID